MQSVQTCARPWGVHQNRWFGLSKTNVTTTLYCLLYREAGIPGRGIFSGSKYIGLIMVQGTDTITKTETTFDDLYPMFLQAREKLFPAHSNFVFWNAHFRTREAAYAQYKKDMEPALGINGIQWIKDIYEFVTVKLFNNKTYLEDMKKAQGNFFEPQIVLKLKLPPASGACGAAEFKESHCDDVIQWLWNWIEFERTTIRERNPSQSRGQNAPQRHIQQAQQAQQGQQGGSHKRYKKIGSMKRSYKSRASMRP